uniref:Uncharacterized protein n=1 Tax=Panagrolaimus sp. ES5 TaxID=591445 RepID=A0AC34GUS1_9BILA
MADLNILKDKKFYHYLLHSLTDHYGKLVGLDNVKLRSEFTKEFFATFWLELMKIAEFNNVPPVNVDDDNKEEVHSGFDSIHRSLFEVCESRIDLRLTTQFVLNCSKLADDEDIVDRNKFMLVLLFVSFWVADKKEKCPNVLLKEPMARLVHACFSKLFKDIYRGKDEEFKTFIFAQTKEHYVSPPDPFFSSPNSTSNTSNLSCNNNVTPNVQRSLQEDTVNESHLDRLSETNEALMKAINLKTENEHKLVADYKHLQGMFNVKTVEIETMKKINAELLMEKENLQQDLLKTKQEYDHKEEDDKNILDQLQFLHDKVKAENDNFKTQLSNATNENDRLKEKNDELTNTVSNHKKNVERLQKELDAKILEFENNNNVFVEQRKLLEEDLSKVTLELATLNNLVIQKDVEMKNILGPLYSLKDVNEKLQKEHDSFKAELSEAVSEIDRLEQNNGELSVSLLTHLVDKEELEEEKKALQEELGAKNIELEDVNKLFGDLLVEKRGIHEDLMKAKNEFATLNNLVFQNNAEMKHILGQLYSLKDVNEKLQKDFDSCKTELSKAVSENDRLEQRNGELNNVVNGLVAENEKHQEEKKALQQEFGDKQLEFDAANKIHSEVVEEKHFLQQELIKTKNMLSESNNIVIQKEGEMKKIVDEKQTLNCIMNKLQMDFDTCKDELIKNIGEIDGLKEENEELKKAVNRKLRNEEKLEAGKQVLQQTLNIKIVELNEAKQLLSRLQAELQHILQQLCSFCLINAQLREELIDFKIFFDNVMNENGNTVSCCFE